MHIFLFSFGLMLMMVAAVNCKTIRGRFSEFKDWAIKTDYYGPIVFGAACGLLMLVIVWPWSY